MNNKLSTDVQLQYMRPGQVDKAMGEFPVVYVPFGLIEWHGRHLPLGNDALKSHAILVKCAEKFGGVVYPPVFFPYAKFVGGSYELHPEEDSWKIDMLTSLFTRIKLMGARVILPVSGHNVNQQNALFDKALEPVLADGKLAGMGLQEITLSRCDESSSDHAAKWETSNMMYFYPDLVDMDALGTKPLAPNKQAPDGIGGLDPREHASAEVGERNVELCVEGIGKKATELLNSLPACERDFALGSLRPKENWWSI